MLCASVHLVVMMPAAVSEVAQVTVIILPPIHSQCSTIIKMGRRERDYHVVLASFYTAIRKFSVALNLVEVLWNGTKPGSDEFADIFNVALLALNPNPKPCRQGRYEWTSDSGRCATVKSLDANGRR